MGFSVRRDFVVKRGFSMHKKRFLCEDGYFYSEGILLYRRFFV